MEELCDGLSQQTAGLKVLLLRNNQITATGMVHLAKALVRDINPALRLEHNQLIPTVAYKYIKMPNTDRDAFSLLLQPE